MTTAKPAIAVALALAGCGGAESPAAVVPADATMYLSVATDARLPYLGRPADELVRDAAELGPLADVRPWAGERVAVFTHRSGMGMAIAASDEEAAMAFARRTRFAHARVIDGHLVLATTRELLRASEESEGFETPDEERALAFLTFHNTAGPRSAEDAGLLSDGIEEELRRFLPPDGVTTVRVRREGRAVGVAGDLPDTPRWADAVRRLGGEPTTLIDLAALWEFAGGTGGSPWVEPGAYVALRDAGEDGRRVIRAVAVPAG